MSIDLGTTHREFVFIAIEPVSLETADMIGHTIFVVSLSFRNKTW